jgi:hypothetical protein
MSISVRGPRRGPQRRRKARRVAQVQLARLPCRQEFGNLGQLAVHEDVQNLLHRPAGGIGDQLGVVLKDRLKVGICLLCAGVGRRDQTQNQ